MMQPVLTGNSKLRPGNPGSPEYQTLKEDVMKTVRKLLMACLLLSPLCVVAASVVNINTADSEALVDELVGIGPQKAMAIVRYRQQNGPFRHADDLALVDGIGAKTVEQNRSRITVAPPKAKP
jgi:competence protein ComEA